MGSRSFVTRSALPAILAAVLALAGMLVGALFLDTPTGGATYAENAAYPSGQQSGQMPKALTTSRITTENALPGTDEWANIGNYDINSLSAFAGATSVNAGSPISIHVKSTGSSLSARLYRLGYYQNHGARLITTFSGISTPAQPACTRNSTTGLVSCPWTPTFTINTDPTWISGIFLLRLDSNNGFRFFVYFTVRNDGYNSDIVMMEPSKTNQAYNSYGGESLYLSNNHEGRTRAYQVSFDRPYSTGAGTGSLFAHDIETVRWLEASGYDVAYISDIDRAANPAILLNHRVFMDQGHDEYWTWQERDNVDAALAAGVNMVFASGNEAYWNIRLSDSAVGPNRVITCYKDAGLDPTPVAPGVTVRFRDPELDRPDNIILGNGYQGYADDSVYRYPWVLYASPDRWYLNCTGFQAGDRVNNISGEEWNATLPNGRAPAGLEIVSRGTMVDNSGIYSLQESVLYTTTGQARVFSAGTIHWSWGLIDHTYPNQVFAAYYQSNDADHRIEQMTANVLDRFTGAWDGSPRACGPANQGFYDIGARPTRTPWPQAFTQSPTATPTRTRTSTPTRTPTITGTPTITRTPAVSATPTASATPSATVTATRSATLSATATSSPTRTATPSPTKTPTSTAFPSPSATPTLPAMLIGHVTWQGARSQPDPSQQQPVTLTLQSGASQTSFPPVVTDASGFFTVTLPGLLPGPYEWRVKGLRSLASCGGVTLGGSGITQQEMGTMQVGDANDDNVVSVVDFNILRATFGSTQDLRADFNNDAVVGAADLALLRSNFGHSGCAPGGSP